MVRLHCGAGTGSSSCGGGNHGRIGGRGTLRAGAGDGAAGVGDVGDEGGAADGDDVSGDGGDGGDSAGGGGATSGGEAGTGLGSGEGGNVGGNVGGSGDGTGLGKPKLGIQTNWSRRRPQLQDGAPLGPCKIASPASTPPGSLLGCALAAAKAALWAPPDAIFAKDP
eukprot:scaffold6587_cov103-Isochrysis_galbana.AAC.9